jgi:sulfur-oxidizing protein SoxY
MNETSASIRLPRRSVIVGGLAIAATGALAQQTPAPPAKINWEDALKSIIGPDAKPIDGKVELTLPEIAESGNTVPFTVNVQSAMTEQEYVKAVHVFATKNPRPDVVSFYFSPLSGKAQALSRMRLAETQPVVAVAEMNDGKFYITRREVKVTIGGCGG